MLSVYYSEYGALFLRDRSYADLETAHEDWDELIDENGWIRIPDPEPHAKRDDEIPV